MRSSMTKISDLQNWTERNRPLRFEREAEAAFNRIDEKYPEFLDEINDVIIELAKTGYSSASFELPERDAGLIEDLRIAFLYRGFLTNDESHMLRYARLNLRWAEEDPEL